MTPRPVTQSFSFFPLAKSGGSRAQKKGSNHGKRCCATLDGDISR